MRKSLIFLPYMGDLQVGNTDYFTFFCLVLLLGMFLLSTLIPNILHISSSEALLSTVIATCNVIVSSK